MLTDESVTDTTDTADESMDEDSPVIRALRKQIKDLQSQAKNAPTRDSIEAEVRADLARQDAIADLLVGLGHPRGMSAVVKARMGDAEVTRESVAEALQALGYAVADGDESAVESGGEAPEAHSDLVNVANLSAQVRAAASGSGKESVEDRIAKAESPEQVAAIMAEAGLSA